MLYSKIQQNEIIAKIDQIKHKSEHLLALHDDYEEDMNLDLVEFNRSVQERKLKTKKVLKMLEEAFEQRENLEHIFKVAQNSIFVQI